MSSQELQALLAHRAWVLRLARCLTAENADAEDLAQDTWVAALGRPPDATRPPRPWLAEVVRNFARMRARRRARGAARPEPATEPEGADDLLARLELQRQVVALVTALEEPYRRVVLLRFFEGKEPAEIARELGVPPGTIRWRLKEGLDRVRARLNARHGRALWAAALLPPPLPPLSAAIAGGLIMSTKTKVLIGAAALLVAGLTATGARLRGGERRPQQGSSGRGVAAGLTASPGSSVAATAGQSATSGPGRHAPPPRFRTAAAARPLAASEARAGWLPKDVIREQVGSVVPAVSDCYQKHLERHPQAGGRVTVRFVIREQAGAGRIDEARIVPKERDGGAPELVDPATELCILHAVATASFPPPGGDVVVSYPFLFSPDGPPDGGP